MPIIRSRHSFDDHFTQIPNAWIRDPRLSLKAKGLLAQLMSHSVGWSISLKSLARDNDCGIDLIRSAIDELRQVGYLVRSDARERDDQGRLGDYIYRTSEPTSEKPTLENPTLENPTPKNNNSKEEKDKEDTLSTAELERDFDEFWKTYPRKVGKEQARKAFRRLYSKHRDDMLNGVTRMANDPNLPEQRYIPHASTWLFRAGWEDEPFPERQRTPEEIALLARQKSEADRARRLEASRQLHEEMDRAVQQAAPPPKCVHGKTIVSCTTCSQRLADGADPNDLIAN